MNLEVRNSEFVSASHLKIPQYARKDNEIITRYSKLRT